YDHEAGTYEEIDLTARAGELLYGKNVLAVEPCKGRKPNRKLPVPGTNKVTPLLTGDSAGFRNGLQVSFQG
ncbi:MAG: hypothetical protein P8Z38_03660, partial [Robiginitalea sp.]